MLIARAEDGGVGAALVDRRLGATRQKIWDFPSRARSFVTDRMIK